MTAGSSPGYKSAGIARDKLKAWSDELGWETLLNRAGTAFRKLPDAEKDGLNEKKALALMLAQPSMIKRPVLESGGKLLVGFTRLGNLFGLIDRGEVSGSARHRVWLGRRISA